MPKLTERLSPAVLLKGAAATIVVAGLGVAAWLVDKALRHPEIRAQQFGYDAPLWIPFALFVLVCVGFVAYLFVRAARRVEAGEDLFAQRHRRRRGEPACQEERGGG